MSKTPDKTKAINLIIQIVNFSDAILTSKQVKKKMFELLDNCGLPKNVVTDLRLTVGDQINSGEVNQYIVMCNLVQSLKLLYDIDTEQNDTIKKE